MENAKPNELSEFMWRRALEECPTWAIAVPVLFAFMVLALIVMFRDDKKLMTGGNPGRMSLDVPPAAGM